MTRDDVLWEADEVMAGRLNLDDCDYPDEVEAELGAMNIDMHGNYRNSQPNWNQMNNNGRKQYEEDEKEFKKMCCCILLIFIIFAVIIAL